MLLVESGAKPWIFEILCHMWRLVYDWLIGWWELQPSRLLLHLLLNRTNNMITNILIKTKNNIKLSAGQHKCCTTFVHTEAVS